MQDNYKALKIYAITLVSDYINLATSSSVNQWLNWKYLCDQCG